MKIFNVDVYGIRESVIRSGYPMQLEVEEWRDETHKEELYQKGLKRIQVLGNAKPSSGHDCALKGMIVQMDIQAPQHFWLQWERYHFQDTISSESTMHKVTKMDISKMCTENTDQRIIDIINEKIEKYNLTKDINDFNKIIESLPEGLQLTRGLTTNYLQLKTMYNQRKHHKMYTWQIFKEWCETLPMFKEFCLTPKEIKK